MDRGDQFPDNRVEPFLRDADEYWFPAIFSFAPTMSVACELDRIDAELRRGTGCGESTGEVESARALPKDRDTPRRVATFDALGRIRGGWFVAWVRNGKCPLHGN